MTSQEVNVKGIPKTETVWETYCPEKGEEYRITSKGDRSFYYLYRTVDGKTTRLGKAKSPLDLRKLYPEAEKPVRKRGGNENG